MSKLDEVKERYVESIKKMGGVHGYIRKVSALFHPVTLQTIEAQEKAEKDFMFRWF